MPPLSFRDQLAADLSGAVLSADPVAVGGGDPPTQVRIRTHFVAMDALSPPRADPLRRRDDPGQRLAGQFAARRDDFAEVEGKLLDWMRAAPGNAERFAEHPATIVAGLPGVKDEVKTRLAPFFRRSHTVRPQLPGAVVTEMTFDAEPASLVPASPLVGKGSVDITSDALLEIGLSQLTRIFAEKLVPVIRQAAANLAFTGGTLRLLGERTGDPVLTRISPDTLRLSIGFTTGQLVLGVLTPVLTALGDVIVDADLKLTSPTFENGQRLGLDLVPGTLAIVRPTAVAEDVWAPVDAALKALLAPLYAYAVPLTFPTGLCGIQPRAVTAGFVPSAAGSDKQDALAIAIALFEGSVPTIAPAAVSRLPAAQDGGLFLSNRLAAAVACCVLSQVPGLAGRPHEEATDSNPGCKWRNIPDFRIGDQVYDELVSLEVSAQDGGLKTAIVLRTSGFGWSATIRGGAEIKLGLTDGQIAVDATTELDLDVNVSPWVYILGILALIGGAVLLVLSKGAGAKFSLGLFTIGVGLLMLSLAYLIENIDDILLAGVDEFANPGEIVNLLPGGLTDGFGQLTFLTFLEWDDLDLGGYMTTPGSPRFVAGGDIALRPGWGIDLDTGDLIAPGDLNAHRDADLRLREPPGLAVERMAPGRTGGGRGAIPPGPIAQPASSGSPIFDDIGISLNYSVEAIGASRMVALVGRPYQTIGYFDLAELGFPAAATSIGVPSPASAGSPPRMKSFAVRTSAGRLASCAVWHQAGNRVMLRYRTFDTPIWLSISTDGTYVEDFGKPEFGTAYILHGTYTAVPGAPWPPFPAPRHQWFWSGVELVGSGLLDDLGNRFSIIGNRCLIETAWGTDLKGWLCATISNGTGLEAVACRNISHIGKIDPPPPVPDYNPRGPGWSGTPGM